MQANELRIGNFVKCELTGDFQKVISIEKGFIKSAPTNENTKGWNVNSIEPITLTPDILEKCGFEYSYPYYTVADVVSLIFSNTGIMTYVMGDNQIKRIQYIHQLQNLYFALTGTELQIEL